jgi:hypothetical protein
MILAFALDRRVLVSNPDDFFTPSLLAIEGLVIKAARNEKAIPCTKFWIRLFGAQNRS